ncbi:hypothetical protein TruAng_003933 [Truncatella angustata]|nr:hypothetical protein TruAng_003933 [Truncatella angustata]
MHTIRAEVFCALNLGSHVKRETSEPPAIPAIPENGGPSTQSPTSSRQEQALQAASQRRREHLRKQWQLESQILEARQRGESSSTEQPEFLRQMDNQKQTSGSPNGSAAAGQREPERERTASPRTRQTAKSEGSPSQAIRALPTPTTAPRRSCLGCQGSYIRGPCAGCRKAYYCSVECQTRDWRRHHAYCSKGISDPGPTATRQATVAPQQTPPHSSVPYRTQYTSAIVLSDSDDDDDEDDDDTDNEDGRIYEDDEQDLANLPIRDNADEVRELIELFAGIPDKDVSPEDRKRAPNALACSLMAHQQVGFTWLAEQEESFRRGAVLADHMGLGKTIQALALILARPSKDSTNKTTLIVAPLALLRQWEREIEDKVKPGYKLKTIIVHGAKKKSMTVAKLMSYDVILTTYGTIAAEYKPRRNTTTKQLLLPIRFHRIILDEAHKIKNDRSQAAQAVSSLRAMYRLCMTGTPLMNNVGELFSLIKFLRIAPYNERLRFRDDLERPLKKSGIAYDRAMKTLQALMGSILLQRTATSQLDGKQILSLPELISENATTGFNDAQREFYISVEHQMQLKFNKYLKAGTVLKNYSYILVLILRLRQSCCHPFLITNHGIPERAQLKPEEMIKLASKLDDHIVERIKAQIEFQCPMCDQISQNPVIVYPCGHHICGECFTGLMIVRDGERGDDDDDELPFPDCPWDYCGEVIDPRKVLCHCFFAEAHMPGDLEALKDDLDEEEYISEDTGADDDGNLKGFIVPDDSQGLSESEEEDEEGVDNNKLENSTFRRSHRRHHPNALESDSGSSSSKEDDGTEKDTMTDDGKKTSSLANKAADSDSDDDFPELNVAWHRVNNQKQSAGPASSLRKGGIPFKRTLKKGPDNAPVQPSQPEDNFDMFRQSGNFFERQAELASQSSQMRTGSKPKRALEDVSDYESGDYSSKRSRTSRLKISSPIDGCNRKGDMTANDDDAAADLQKRKQAKGKGIARPKKAEEQASSYQKDNKKKTKNLTIFSNLKAESNKNVAAKAKYLKRLRKDYEPSAKIDRTMELLRDIRENNPQEKTLIFSVFTSFLDILEIPIQDEGNVYRRYDGAMCHNDREQAVDDFMKKPEVKIMLVSLQAGNAGLNLQAATQVIILDPFWNPSIEDQAVGRAHRLGQKKPVTVHKVLIEDTIEDRIVELQEKKKALVGEVLNHEAARSMGRLSVSELTRLFGIGVGPRRRRR